MSPRNRRQTIANFLDQEGPLTVRQLGVKIGLDITTLHLDLAVMEREGLVSKTENKGWRFKARNLPRWTYKLERAV